MPISPFKRFDTAHCKLQEALREARKEHDERGFHYYSPELCDAAGHFEDELRRAGAGDELLRRATITATMTSLGTPYADALTEIHRLFGFRYTPMAVLKGGMPCHQNMLLIRRELESVRRLLGPIGPKDLTPQQRGALRTWERELELIENEADGCQANGCQWLRSLSEYGKRLREGVPLPAERPIAEYDDNFQPTVIHSAFTLPASAISEMQVAANGVFESVGKKNGLATNPDSPAIPAVTTRPTTKKELNVEWLAKAMLWVRDQPGWSDATIARLVGKHPATLSRNDTYQVAAATARGSKTNRPRGHITVNSDTGLRTGVEAVAPNAGSPEDKSDRGQPIAGSKYFREYCVDCNEPIGVPQEQVGTNPVCEHCQG